MNNSVEKSVQEKYPSVQLEEGCPKFTFKDVTCLGSFCREFHKLYANRGMIHLQVNEVYDAVIARVALPDKDIQDVINMYYQIMEKEK